MSLILHGEIAMQNIRQYPFLYYSLTIFALFRNILTARIRTMGNSNISATNTLSQ
jgi:hypothetical protein